MKKTNFDLYLEEQVRDPDFAKRFEEAGKQWDIALQIAARRRAAGLSQTELAKRVGTTQQQISRLEQAGYSGSLNTLRRIAEAIGATLEIRLISPTPHKAVSAVNRQLTGAAPSRERSPRHKSGRSFATKATPTRAAKRKTSRSSRARVKGVLRGRTKDPAQH